jgi:Methyltransferase domain
MGNLDKTMRKSIFLLFCFLTCFAQANSDLNQTHVEALKVHVCGHLPNLMGWCTREKALSFIDLVLEVRPQVCVDIGSFGGSSVLPVASALKFLGQGVVIAIDPWDKIEALKHFDPFEDQRHMDWWGKVDFNQVYQSYLNMIRVHDLGKYCKTMKMTSEKAASQIPSIDILYIDGNHSEEIAAQDVMLYLPKVISGGYIWLNDSTWPCMQPAIALLQESCDVVRLIDNGNCILFKKR